MAPKQRGFAARTTSMVESAGNVAGMVCWTLTDNSGGDKMSKLSVAWKASAKGTPVFALALGDQVPQFDDMWTEHSRDGEIMTGSLLGSLRSLPVMTLALHTAYVLAYSEAD